MLTMTCQMKYQLFSGKTTVSVGFDIISGWCQKCLANECSLPESYLAMPAAEVPAAHSTAAVAGN